MAYDSPTMAGEAEDQSEPANDESQEYTSVFIPKEALNKDYKVGDTVSLTVKDVDPETGEVEAVCEKDKMSETKTRPSMMSEAIDSMEE